MKILKILALPSILLTGGILPAEAQVAYSDFLSPSFGGTTSTDGWFDLNSTNFPGYGSFGTAMNPWPAPIGSNQSGSGDALLDKLAGTSGYVASAATNAIYSPNATGTFMISDTTPVSGLSNLLIQVSSTGNIGTSAFTLDINGGDQNIAPTDSALLFSGGVNTSFGPATKYIWAFQWDLSAFGPISSFSASWTTAEPHNLTFGARVDQGSEYVEAVPEPSTCLLLAIGLVAVTAGRRGRSSGKTRVNLV